MKKYIALLLCILLFAISLAACANNEGEETDTDAPSNTAEQSETETEEEEEEYTSPVYEETDPPEVTVDEKELGEAGVDGEGDWSGYYPKS